MYKTTLLAFIKQALLKKNASPKSFRLMLKNYLTTKLLSPLIEEAAQMVAKLYWQRRPQTLCGFKLHSI